MPGWGQGQAGCPGVADGPVTRGWARYRTGAIAAADSLFTLAVRRCPEHIGARVGRGFAALRGGDNAEAGRWLEAVAREAPRTVDALVGLGILAWRQGDLAQVRDRFLAVRRLDPDNREAAEYLAKLPAGAGPPPGRPPLRLPDSTQYVVRANGDRLEALVRDRWEPFYVKGVNLGAALPGKYPAEFPPGSTYAGWLADMAEMGANTVRVYTIHPPAFYHALEQHNARGGEPLRLFQGVWAELPPNNRFDDPAWERAFFNEMTRAVDAVHGRADLPPRAGHAAGHYTTNVARWTAGFIVGREWEPYAVKGYNRHRPADTSFQGAFLTVHGATPMDAWLARALEHLVAYQTRTYRTQHPVAYTSWPTLDPLTHPTEASDGEEVAIRRRYGEVARADPREFDNDAVSLDPTVMTATGDFPAGIFAAYHAYPYYPDFIILDPTYDTAQSSLGRSTYFGYLRQLKARHRAMPVVIAEYGVPAGLGIAHLQPQGWHHGGHDEAAMARINARLTREIAQAGMAGGMVFAWIDEWFKRNWLVADFEIPVDRNAQWLNRLDPEQQYGVIAMEPVPAVAGATLAARLREWRGVPPLYQSGHGTFRAAVDAAGLWILFQPAGSEVSEMMLGLDLLRPEAGALRWPGRVGPEIPIGVEFIIRVTPDQVHVLAAPGSNPWRVLPIASPKRSAYVAPSIAQPPAGFFAGRWALEPAGPYRTVTSTEGRYDSLRVVTNPRRFGRDGTEYAALGYDRGVLLQGAPPDGAWERDVASGALELRIPWLLINVTDPSGRYVLQSPGDSVGDLAAVQVDGIGLVVAARLANGEWIGWPASGRRGEVARVTWQTWETPRWQARRRPAFAALSQAFRGLSPGVVLRKESP